MCKLYVFDYLPFFSACVSTCCLQLRRLSSRLGLMDSCLVFWNAVLLAIRAHSFNRILFFQLWLQLAAMVDAKLRLWFLLQSASDVCRCGELFCVLEFKLWSGIVVVIGSCIDRWRLCLWVSVAVAILSCVTQNSDLSQHCAGFVHWVYFEIRCFNWNCRWQHNLNSVYAQLNWADLCRELDWLACSIFPWQCCALDFLGLLEAYSHLMKRSTNLLASWSLLRNVLKFCSLQFCLFFLVV